MVRLADRNQNATDVLEYGLDMTHQLTFESFFEEITANLPHRWQSDLSAPSECGSRLIRIPTGFGKTLGVVAVWLWHRVVQKDESWPRRLVWCLPLRVLVEQTEYEVRSALGRAGCLWDGKNEHHGKVGIHLLMGGADANQWYLHPEHEAVLIGTQDMLLSRAMNRGYACPRARWPMEFGLLSQDALWVMDEVQLMDVGLATSGQLQSFRDEDLRGKETFRPCHTWWMSATLQPDWLKKSPDTKNLSEALESSTYRIEETRRTGHLWSDVHRPLEVIEFEHPKALASRVAEAHLRRQTDADEMGPTIVVVNTVSRCVETWEALKKSRPLQDHGTDLRLVHSRFRPFDRKGWRDEFLNRKACNEPSNRIIVSTQVVEAGVDISTSLLFTELAPWPNLVQRFGRSARWGGTGRVIVADFGYAKEMNEKMAAPYSLVELEASLRVLHELVNVAPRHLEEFEESHPDLLPRLYPYEPRHLLLRHELDELFDTSSDLSGADIDISRFIRSGDERDVQVFWAEVQDGGEPSPSRKPNREELCSVPFLRAQEWLCGIGRSEKLSDGKRAWVWDWLTREWRSASRRDLYPGQTVLVDARVGGYSHEQGWDKSLRGMVEPVSMSEDAHYEDRPCWKWDRTKGGWEPSQRRIRRSCPEDDSNDSEDDESLSVLGDWQTIAAHGLQVGSEIDRIATLVSPNMRTLLNLAGRWHDLGKSHPAFQGCIQSDDRPHRDDIAKAPDRAWPCNQKNMYRISEHEQRQGFRHELASTLALFAILQRHQPEHEALLGPWQEWLNALGEMKPAATATSEPSAIEQEILELNAAQFDLLAYIVCAHHGKVRMAWHSGPSDQKAKDTQLRIRGVRNGDLLPPVTLALGNENFHQLPATKLDLSPAEIGLSIRTGRSWTERTICLLENYGPFCLAWLETLLRVADQRASKGPVSDTLLAESQLNDQGAEDVQTELETSNQALARSDHGGTPATSSASDSEPRGELHGYGRGASGRDLDSGTTRAPYGATRYVETEVGILSYQALAPLLAERVGHAEFDISVRKFAELRIEDLLLELHRRVCGDLLPRIAGRWRVRNVRTGAHTPPQYWRVPMQMREFAANLDERLSNIENDEQSQSLRDLAFAEGRFLHIHPFEDFNGRVARLFLIELLHRMELPVIDTATRTSDERKNYFQALRAYDRNDPRPLIGIWKKRLSEAAA